jgi:phytoene desaturase
MEKNATIGGRARAYSHAGFTFDMGPSWYWMPDIFERFFGAFGKSPADYYNLVQLDPGFQIVFGKNDTLAIPARLDGIYEVFESIEKGSADKLKQFLKEGAFKYKVGMNELVYKPSFSWLEFASMEVVAGAAQLHMFKPVSKYVRTFFKDERLIALMEFPVLFLGAMANQIPALYSLMNYAALQLGTWYPMGGMIEIVKGMESLAVSMGVDMKTNCEAEQIVVAGNRAKEIVTNKGTFATDGIIATGDYHHIEQKLLDKQYRTYTEEYWDKRTLAPSSLIFYIGVSKKVKKLIHHNLFFDASMEQHSIEIYEQPEWPKNPLFYVCCPSKTDPSVAPEGMENLFILIPVAPDLKDTEEIRQKYFEIVIKRLEALCEDEIKEHIVYNRSYCINDFKADYHAYKGNAYGLANTLRQTAVLKPTMRNKKVKNMFFAGQLTVPGPGVPPALVSGQVAAQQLLKTLK